MLFIITINHYISTSIFSSPQSQKNGRKLKRCIYQEMHTPDMFTQFRSVKNDEWYLGFTKAGDPKSAKKSKFGTRATKFVKRTWATKAARQHTKRNVGKRGKKKIICWELWRKRRLRKRERKGLFLLSSFCLEKPPRKIGEGLSAGAISRCKRFFHRNRCR